MLTKGFLFLLIFGRTKVIKKEKRRNRQTKSRPQLSVFTSLITTAAAVVAAATAATNQVHTTQWAVGILLLIIISCSLDFSLSLRFFFLLIENPIVRGEKKRKKKTSRESLPLFPDPLDSWTIAFQVDVCIVPISNQVID